MRQKSVDEKVKTGKGRLSVFLWPMAMFAFQMSVFLPLAAQECLSVTKVHEIQSGSSLFSVAYHDNTWLAVGRNGLVLKSNNGLDWVPLDPGTQHNLIEVVWAGDRFAILASHFAPASMTLLTWTEADGFVTIDDLLPDGLAHAMGWDGTKLIIGYDYPLFDVGFFTTVVDFNTVGVPEFELGVHCGIVNHIKTINGRTIITVNCFDIQTIPHHGIVHHSTDGNLFESEAIGPYEEAFGANGLGSNGEIAFVRGIFRPLGSFDHEYLFAHTNQIGVEPFEIYISETMAFRHQLADAAWATDTFVGVGPEGKLGFSEEGLNWSEIRSPNTGELYAVIPTTENKFVAVGEHATILVGDVNPSLRAYAAWPASVTCSDLIQDVDACTIL